MTNSCTGTTIPLITQSLPALQSVAEAKFGHREQQFFQVPYVFLSEEKLFKAFK
jgi:hypothetical protein